jgi:hypothetical protein
MIYARPVEISPATIWPQSFPDFFSIIQEPESPCAVIDSISLHRSHCDQFGLHSVPRKITVLTSSNLSLYFNFKNVEEPLMVPDFEPFDPVQVATVKSLLVLENLRIGSMDGSPTRRGMALEMPNPFAVISTRAQSKLCRDFNDVLIKIPSMVSLETFSMVTWVSCKDSKDR